MNVSLRDYQVIARDAALECMQAHGRPLLVMPTGTGKTRTFVGIIERHLDDVPDGRVLVIAHTIELLKQAQETLRALLPGVQVGIDAGAAHRATGAHRVICGSVATLRNPARRPDGITLVIVDEAHRIQSATHGSIVRDYTERGAHIMGVTATPDRLDGKPLGEFFTDVPYKMGLTEALDRGFLVPLRCVGVGTTASTDGLRTRLGDYVDTDVESAIEPLCDQVATGVARQVGSRQGISFAVTVRSAEQLSAALNRAGVRTEVVVGTTPPKVRERIIREFKSGELQAISSVAALIEGFDHPDTAWGLFAIATKSKTKYRQAAGRIMRPAPGKSEGMWIDLFNSSIELSVAGRKELLKGRVSEKSKPKMCAADLFDDVDELVAELQADADAERLAKARLDARRSDLGLSSRYVWAATPKGTPVLKVEPAGWVGIVKVDGGYAGRALMSTGRHQLGVWPTPQAARDAIEDGVYDHLGLRRYATKVARDTARHDAHRAQVAMEGAAVFDVA